MPYNDAFHIIMLSYESTPPCCPPRSSTQAMPRSILRRDNALSATMPPARLFMRRGAMLGSAKKGMVREQR